MTKGVRVGCRRMTSMNSEGSLFECCINCNALFEDGFDPVRHVSISFHTSSDSEEEDGEAGEESRADRKEISILDALSSIFISNGLMQLKKANKPEESDPHGMCFKCAQTLSHLYQAYIELLAFSDPAARICQLIGQIELWHKKNSLMIIPDEVIVKEEVVTDPFYSSQASPGENLADYVDTVLDLERNDEEEDTEDDLKSNKKGQCQSEVLVKEESDESSKTPVKPRRSTRSAPGIIETPSEPVRRGRGRPPGQGNNVKRKVKSTSHAKRRREGILRRAALKLEKSRLPQTPIPETPKEENADDGLDEFSLPPKKVRRERSKPRGFRFCPQPNCEKKYYFKWRIEMHLLADHQNKKLSKCKKCSFKYFDIAHLKEHICLTRKERRASGLLYRCEYCGQSFAKQSRCNQHAATHDSYSEQIKCPIPGCRKRFRVPEKLERHVREHEDGAPPVRQKMQEPAQCQVCGKVLANSRQLIRHMLIHDSDKKFLCVQCGKGFQQRTGLNNHMLIHQEKRKYQCPLCGVGFKRSCHLKVHYKSRTHENEPEKIAELLKQDARQNASGPVIIPKKNTFKNHHTWAGHGRERRQTNKHKHVQPNVEEAEQQSSNSNPDELQPSGSHSTPPVPEIVEDRIPQLPQPFAPFPLGQAAYIPSPFARSTAQFYGYPFTDY